MDWELDDDGDLIIPLVFTSGLGAVAQGISIRLKTFKGEWFLDVDHGVPYFENDVVTDPLIGGKFNELKALAAFRPVIAASPGVDEIVRLAVQFTAATRECRVDWRVRVGDEFISGTDTV